MRERRAVDSWRRAAELWGCRLRPADARELVARLGLIRRGCGLHRGDFAGWLARNDRREIFENVSRFFLPDHGSRRGTKEQLYEWTGAVQKWDSASTQWLKFVLRLYIFGIEVRVGASEIL